MPDRPLNRICYVEDDEDIQRIVRMSLERVGKMKVALVTDPSQAIATIAEFHPDLVMLDWMMPVMDGPTLFRQLSCGRTPRRCRWCSLPPGRRSATWST